MAVAQDFVRHTAYAQAIAAGMGTRKRTSAFWPQTYNAHFKAAVHDWCKVFGSKGLNTTHWKNTPVLDAEIECDKFRKRLLKEARLDPDSWNACWEKMRTFRDTYAAHVELDRSPEVPMLSTALNVAYAYDDWCRELIMPDVLTERKLKVFHKDLFDDALRIVMSADGIEAVQ